MRQRGLGNPNARGGGARQDAQDAITKKFQHMQTAFQREAKIEALKNTDSATRNNVLKLVERKIKELSDQLDKTTGSGPEANVRAQLAAWNHWKTTFEAKGLEKTGAVDITKNFYAWLLGKGVEEDHRRTPWYRDQALLELPDVQEWIDGFNDVLSESQNELLKLVWKTPQNLEEAWLYYKYVVHMDWMQKEDRFFWVDMINLMEEKAKLGGGYLQSQLDDPNVNTPTQEITKDGVTYRIPLNQNDAFNPAKFPAYQPLDDKEKLRRSLTAQLQELADVHKLTSLDPVVPVLREEVRHAATRDLQEAMDVRPAEEVAVELEEAVGELERVYYEDVLSHARHEELDQLVELSNNLKHKVQGTETWGSWFVETGWRAVQALAPSAEMFGQDEPPAPPLEPEQRAEVKQAISETKDEIARTMKRIAGKVLEVEVVNAVNELEGKVRLLENQVEFEEKADEAMFTTAEGEQRLRATLLTDSLKPLDTAMITRQADFLSSQATRGMDDVKKNTVKQVTRLAMAMQQFETDRAAMLLTGPSIAQMDVMQTAFEGRWKAALTGLGITPKEKEAWLAKGIDLDLVGRSGPATQNFVQALFNVMGEQGRAFFNISKYATMQATLGALQELLPIEPTVRANFEQYGLKLPENVQSQFSSADYFHLVQLQNITKGLEMATPVERWIGNLVEGLESFGKNVFSIVKISATHYAFESALLGAVRSVAIPLVSLSGAPVGVAVSFLASLATQTLFNGLPGTFNVVKRQVMNAMFSTLLRGLSGHFTSTDYTTTMAQNFANGVNELAANQAEELGNIAASSAYKNLMAPAGIHKSLESGTVGAMFAFILSLGMAATQPWAVPVAATAGAIGAITTYFGQPEPVARGVAAVVGSTVKATETWARTVTVKQSQRLLEDPQSAYNVIMGVTPAHMNPFSVPFVSRAQVLASLTSLGQNAQKLFMLSQYLAQVKVSPIDRLLNMPERQFLPFFETDVSARNMALMQAINGAIVSSPLGALANFDKLRAAAHKAMNLNNISIDNVQSDWEQWLVQQRAVAHLARTRQKAVRRLKPPKSRGLFQKMQTLLDQRTGEGLVKVVGGKRAAVQ